MRKFPLKIGFAHIDEKVREVSWDGLVIQKIASNAPVRKNTLIQVKGTKKVEEDKKLMPIEVVKKDM